MLGQRALPADMKNRTLGTKCRGHSGHGIGAAGTSGGDDAAESTGLTGVAVCSMSRRLLMAYVNDLDALVQTAIININNVATA